MQHAHMHDHALRIAATSRGHDFRAYTDAQIESASDLVALQASPSDPHFFHYVASIVADMKPLPAAHSLRARALLRAS